MFAFVFIKVTKVLTHFYPCCCCGEQKTLQTALHVATLGVLIWMYVSKHVCVYYVCVFLSYLSRYMHIYIYIHTVESLSGPSLAV